MVELKTDELSYEDRKRLARMKNPNRHARTIVVNTIVYSRLELIRKKYQVNSIDRIIMRALDCLTTELIAIDMKKIKEGIKAE